MSLTYVFDANALTIPAAPCSADCSITETTFFEGVVTSSTSQVVALPSDELVAPETADSLFLKVSGKDWTNKGAVTIRDPEFPAPIAPTLSYLGGGAADGISLSAQFDAGRSSDDSVLITHTGTGSIHLKIVLFGVVDEDEALWRLEEDADFTDEEFAQFMVDSPAMVDPNPSDVTPGCSTSPGQLELCLEAAQQPTGPAVDEVCTDFSLQTEQWVLDDRYTACRNLKYSVKIPTGAFVVYLVFILQQRVDLAPRSAEYEVRSRFHIAEESEWASYATFDVDAACTRDLTCNNVLDTQFDLYEGQSSEWLESRVEAELPQLGLVKFLSSDYILNFQLGLEDGRRSTTGKAYQPITRCDSETYMKAGARNTSGCVLPAFDPIFARVKLGRSGVEESAQHIYDAQQAGRPGAVGSQPLSRNRDRSEFRESRRITKAQCLAERPRRGLEDCDEYAFASTEQSCAFVTCSAKWIDRSDNRRAGAYLGAFYKALRILDDNEFFVDVVPTG
jgi:Deoxyribonuclease NucA/NucB